MIDTAIFSKLSTNAPVAAVVSTRIFPRRIPQTADYPCVAFDATEKEGDVATTGEGFKYFDIEVASVARTSDAAKALADLIHNALHNESGTWGGVVVLGSWILEGKDQTYSIDATPSLTYFVVEKTFQLIVR